MSCAAVPHGGPGHGGRLSVPTHRRPLAAVRGHTCIKRGKSVWCAEAETVSPTDERGEEAEHLPQLASLCSGPWTLWSDRGWRHEVLRRHSWSIRRLWLRIKDERSCTVRRRRQTGNSWGAQVRKAHEHDPHWKDNFFSDQVGVYLS